MSLIRSFVWALLVAIPCALPASAQVGGDGPTLVIHEIADLLDDQVGLLGADISPDDEAATRVREGDALLELVRAFMEPRFEADRHELRLLGEGSLVARLDGGQHQWLEAFLTTQRQSAAHGGELLLISALVVSGSAEALAAHGLDAAEQVFEPGQLDLLDLELRRAEGVSVLQAPMLAVYSRQRATISVTNALSYVTRWERHVVEPDEQVVLDPVIETVQDGIVWEGRAVLLPDGLCGLQVALQLADVARPLTTRQVRPDPELPAQTISIPVVTTVSMASTLTLEPGAVAALMAPRDAEQEVAVLVSVERVEEVEQTETALEALPRDDEPQPTTERRPKEGGR